MKKHIVLLLTAATACVNSHADNPVVSGLVGAGLGALAGEAIFGQKGTTPCALLGAAVGAASAAADEQPPVEHHYHVIHPDTEPVYNVFTPEPDGYYVRQIHALRSELASLKRQNTMLRAENNRLWQEKTSLERENMYKAECITALRSQMSELREKNNILEREIAQFYHDHTRLFGSMR